MLKNERGNVMSIALIVLAILTFSISTVSVYTYNVASRSTNEVQNRSDDSFARSLIDSVRYELKSYLIDYLGDPSYDSETFTFNDDAFQNYMIDKIALLENAYNVMYDEENYAPEIETSKITEFSITYIVKVEKPNGDTLYRDLYVSFDDEAEPPNMEEAFSSIVRKIVNDDDTEWLCEDDEEECDVDSTFIDRYGDSTGEGRGNQPIWSFGIDENTTVVVQGDLTTSGHLQQGELDLNGSTLLIDGDLILNEIRKIIGPGMLIVTGNFHITNEFGITVYDDVLILVEGESENEEPFKSKITFTHDNHDKRTIEAFIDDDLEEGEEQDKFAWITLKDPNEIVLETNASNVYENEDDVPENINPVFVQHDLDDEFTYLGSVYYDPINWNELLGDYTVEYSAGFNFSDGSFKTED